jgi:translation initiation factor IF-3
MQRAREAGLDLVEVDSNGNPPVCRILDYGKWKYEQAKKEREGRKHQKGTMIHEVRMRPRTGQHDIDLKVRIAGRLLAEGDKVKLSVMFRGRELSHPEVGQEVLDKALKGIGDLATIEKPPGMEGRFLTVIMTPTAKKVEKPEKPAGGKGAPAPTAEASPDGAIAAAMAKAEAAAQAPPSTNGKEESGDQGQEDQKVQD